MTDPLRNYETWRQSIRNFEWLQDAAPGAMDVDFLLERGGQFLIVEAKPWMKGVSVPYGQHKALLALSRLPKARVYLAGEDGERLHLACYNTSPAPIIRKVGRKCDAWWPPDRFIPSDQGGLRVIVRAWWEDASVTAA